MGRLTKGKRPTVPEARRCTAHVVGSGGRRCNKAAIKGGTVCDTHGGRAGQVKAKAAERVRDLLGEAIDPDRSMREAARLAYSDIRELYDADGKLLPIKEWPDDIARAVKSIESVTGNVDKGDGKFDQVVKIQLWDKPRKVENLMKHHGQLNEQVNVSLTVNLVSRLESGRKRLLLAEKNG